MGILEPSEFRKCFEQSERYATAALEIKKLSEAKLAIKKAKTAKDILNVDRTVKQALQKTRAVLLDWERSLSPRFKQLVGSRKLFKELDQDIKINERNLQKSAAEAGKPAEKVKKADVAGTMKYVQSKLDNVKRSVKEIEDFLAAYVKIEPTVKKETIAPADLVKLQNNARKLLPSVAGIRQVLPDLKQRCEDLSQSPKAISSSEQSKVKDSLDRIVKIEKKLDSYGKLEEIVNGVKTLHKKLYDDKSGWLTLVKSFNSQAGDVLKEIGSAIRVVDANLVKLRELDAKWPDRAKLSNDECIKRAPSLREFTKKLSEAPQKTKIRARNIESTCQDFDKRKTKLLGAEIYEDQSKNDNAFVIAAQSLNKSMKSLEGASASYTKRVAEYLAAVESALATGKKRLADYDDAEAAKKLGK